jgi:two-component system, chemotaxis family, sensor kinase CheA
MSPLDPSVFVAKFVEEARDRLKALGGSLLALERADDAQSSGEAIAEALRQAHSLKGSALMLGFTDMSQVSHQLEDLFIEGGRNPSLLDADTFDVVFASIDLLTSRVEQLARGMMDPVEIGEISVKLTGLINRGKVPQSVPLSVPAEPEPEAFGVSTPAPEVRRIRETRESLRVPIDKLDRLTHLAPEMVVQSLKAFERQSELRRIERQLSRLRDRAREARLTPAAAADSGALGEYADALDSVTRRVRDFLVQFSDDRVRLSLITEELRQTVIELTMLPLASVFDAFPRAVRDLARSFDKRIELTVRGRDTELDKKIIEQLTEPLIHLMRNAVDHGIETPEERLRRGKPPEGQLQLTAEQQGNRILIVLRDDGRGIDPGALRAAAVRQGIASEQELRSWTKASLVDLIYRPGFSTRSSATDVSGRGIGMEVVKGVVERLGGTIRVQSEPGRGTTITLNLPLSLALLRIVLVEAGEELFAFPTAALRRIVQVEARDIGGRPHGVVVELGGENMLLTSLTTLLNLSSPPAGARQTVLVAESGEGRFGLLVEAVHEEQELVFKELRGPLRDQHTFTGAALLGNGEIVPILDVSALFEMSLRPSLAAGQAPAQRRAAARRPRVLVVDDSLVASELQRNILIAAGYEAEIGQDGAEALELLRQKPCDLVIADIDMPRVNGFELTERMRADEQFRDIPVIIVTARDSMEDRQRGFEAGADAYVLKREFDQSQLLDTVRRLVGRGAESRGTYA